jgi:hypothetical protein
VTTLIIPKNIAPHLQSQMAVAAPPRDGLRLIRLGYCALVLLTTVVQLAVFGKVEDNVASTVIACASSILGILYALDAKRFRTYPISALTLLFFTTTATSGALLVKTMEWSALSDRLSLPVTTFAVMAAAQVSIIAGDLVYLRFKPFRTFHAFIARRALVPWGVMRWPTDLELWILGALGLFSVLTTGTDHESAATFGMGGAGAKLIRAWGFLKFAPFLIPFRDSLSGFPSRIRTPWILLAIYFVGLIGISFATNSRSTFADAVPTIGACVLLAIGVGRIDIRRIPISRIVILAIVALVASSLLSRVALAMVVVRDYRGVVDTPALVRLTLEALFNSEWLAVAKSKMDVENNIGDYSETYVDSRFAARFLLTKFHDNIIYFFSLMGPDHIAAYKEFMFDRLAATLPDPILHKLGLNIDKSDLMISNGDYTVYIVDGWGLGGYKTGSMIGEVYGVFGWAMVPVMMGATLMLFAAYDSFAVRTAAGRLAFSPMIILLIWSLIGTTASFGYGAESVTAIPAGIVRGIPQNILCYVVTAWIARSITRVLGRS